MAFQDEDGDIYMQDDVEDSVVVWKADKQQVTAPKSLLIDKAGSGTDKIHVERFAIPIDGAYNFWRFATFVESHLEFNFNLFLQNQISYLTRMPSP